MNKWRFINCFTTVCFTDQIYKLYKSKDKVNLKDYIRIKYAY